MNSTAAINVINVTKITTAITKDMSSTRSTKTKTEIYKVKTTTKNILDNLEKRLRNIHM